MELINFGSLSIFQAAALFAIAAVVVYVAGTKLSAYSDDLAEKTGLGRAFIGFLLLGGVTSLPEAATTITASAGGNANLAGSNLIGSINMQIVLLAVLNFWHRERSIAANTSSVAVMMQGMLLILLLSSAGIFILSPLPQMLHIGLETVFLFLLFLYSIYLVHRYSHRHRSTYNRTDEEEIRSKIKLLEAELDQSEEEDILKRKMPLKTYLAKKGTWFLVFALLILVAGYIVVNTSELIASRTGMTNNFAGYLMVAVTTSLPEVSTTIGALKLKRYDMAFSNIFGTNLLNVAMLFIADLFYTEGPVLAALDHFSLIAALIAIILTVVFLTGISSASRKRVLGIGYESMAIIIIYVLGSMLLFFY